MTVVEGDQKAPFSIATTPRCRGRRYSFPWIAPLYTWYVHYNAEWYVRYNARRYKVPFLKSLVWCNLGLNPGLPGHWRTLYPFGQWAVTSWWVPTPVSILCLLSILKPGERHEPLYPPCNVLNCTISWANYCFRVFVKHHFNGNSSFGKAIFKKYLIYLCTESNSCENSTSRNVASRLFACTPSMIRYIVWIF